MNLTLLNLILIISRRIRLAFFVPFTCTALMAVYTLVIPEIYESPATILPATASKGSLSLGSLAGFDLSSFGFGAEGGDLYRYNAILLSREVADDVIKTYNLQELYETQLYADLLKIYYENLNVSIDDELGTLTVSFRYPDNPIKAAEITNYFLARIRIVNQDLETSLAVMQRDFIKQRYSEALKTIASLEDSLARQQEKHGIIEIEQQGILTLEALAKLKTKMIESEIKLSIFTKQLGKDHPETIAESMTLDELGKQFSKIDRSITTDFFLPKSRFNQLALENLRIKKDLEINYKIQEFLLPQYEQAKIQVVKEVPDFQVLDFAKPSDKRVYPKRTIMCLLTAVISFIFVVGLILTLEQYRNLNTEEDSNTKLTEISDNVRNSLRFAKRNKT